jgi:DNA (cytosine-5)-methyltransferase 1
MLQVPELKRAMGLDSLQNQAGEKVDFLINHGSRRDKLKILGNGVCEPSYGFDNALSGRWRTP